MLQTATSSRQHAPALHQLVPAGKRGLVSHGAFHVLVQLVQELASSDSQARWDEEGRAPLPTNQQRSQQRMRPQQTHRMQNQRILKMKHPPNIVGTQGTQATELTRPQSHTRRKLHGRTSVDEALTVTEQRESDQSSMGKAGRRCAGLVCRSFIFSFKKEAAARSAPSFTPSFSFHLSCPPAAVEVQRRQS